MVEKLIDDPSELEDLLNQIKGWDMIYPYLDPSQYKLLIVLLTILAGNPEIKGWKKGVTMTTMINTIYLMKEEEYNEVSNL